jgi:E3 ubiquitin-protein ligase SHPRH
VCRAEQHTRDIYTVSCSKIEDIDDQIQISGSWSSKIDEIVKCVLRLKSKEADVKIIIFSHWDNILNVIGKALEANSITFRLNKGNFEKMIKEFKDFKQNVTCLLMNLKLGSKGLNLTEATHCFLVEPIISPADELQAVGRIHRIGQLRPTFVSFFGNFIFKCFI